MLGCQLLFVYKERVTREKPFWLKQAPAQLAALREKERSRKRDYCARRTELEAAIRIISMGSRQQSDAHRSVGSYEEPDKGSHFKVTHSYTQTLAHHDMTVQAKAFTLAVWGL